MKVNDKEMYEFSVGSSGEKTGRVNHKICSTNHYKESKAVSLGLSSAISTLSSQCCDVSLAVKIFSCFDGNFTRVQLITFLLIAIEIAILSITIRLKSC